MNTTTTLNRPETDTEECIAKCNSLLRGEISAVEAYEKVIEKFADEPEVASLQRFRSEHELAVHKLRAQVIEMHAIPETESGAWGYLTGAIQSAANLIGESSAISSLQQGEMLGQRAYADFLESPEPLPECKVLVRDTLLPMVNRHIEQLEKMNAALSES